MTDSELQQRLQEICPRPIRLKLHENRSVYASAQKEPCGRIFFSLHRLFLQAPTPVLQAIVRFAMHPDRNARFVIRQMAHLYFTEIQPPKQQPVLMCPKGQHVDLQNIYDRINREYFGGELAVAISWFKTPHYRKFSHITFGMYDRTGPAIKINGLLDSLKVPLSFVEFVVYHEMLHIVCKPKLDSLGRLRVHTPEFRRKEEVHPHYEFAKAWEKQSIKFFKSLRGSHGRP